MSNNINNSSISFKNSYLFSKYVPWNLLPCSIATNTCFLRGAKLSLRPPHNTMLFPQNRKNRSFSQVSITFALFIITTFSEWCSRKAPAYRTTTFVRTAGIKSLLCFKKRSRVRKSCRYFVCFSTGVLVLTTAVLPRYINLHHPGDSAAAYIFQNVFQSITTTAGCRHFRDVSPLIYLPQAQLCCISSLLSLPNAHK